MRPPTVSWPTALAIPRRASAGRLTLNPIPHIDLFFTILLPLFLILSGSGFIFGGAKPVPVDVSRLRHPRRDWALVGAAGPAVNVVIAVGADGRSLGRDARWAWSMRSSSLTEILAVGIFLNALLAVFNLIPIPPLDGSRVVQYFLSGEALGAVSPARAVRPARSSSRWCSSSRGFQAAAQRGRSSAWSMLIATPFGVAADVEPLPRSGPFGDLRPHACVPSLSRRSDRRSAHESDRRSLGHPVAWPSSRSASGRTVTNRSPPVAADQQQRRLVARSAADGRPQLVDRLDRLAVHLLDDVAGLDARVGGAAVGIHVLRRPRPVASFGSLSCDRRVPA